jgi:hypothetical protein
VEREDDRRLADNLSSPRLTHLSNNSYTRKRGENDRRLADHVF